MPAAIPENIFVKIFVRDSFSKFNYTYGWNVKSINFCLSSYSFSLSIFSFTNLSVSPAGIVDYARNSSTAFAAEPDFGFSLPAIFI